MGIPVLHSLNQQAGLRSAGLPRVPWDLEPDLLRQSRAEAASQHRCLTAPQHGMPRFTPSQALRSLSVPHTHCSTSLPAPPSHSPQGTTSNTGLPKSREILGDMMPPSF